MVAERLLEVAQPKTGRPAGDCGPNAASFGAGWAHLPLRLALVLVLLLALAVSLLQLLGAGHRGGDPSGNGTGHRLIARAAMAHRTRPTGAVPACPSSSDGRVLPGVVACRLDQQLGQPKRRLVGQVGAGVVTVAKFDAG